MKTCIRHRWDRLAGADRFRKNEAGAARKRAGCDGRSRAWRPPCLTRSREHPVTCSGSEARLNFAPIMRYALVFAEHDPIMFEMGDILEQNKIPLPLDQT